MNPKKIKEWLFICGILFLGFFGNIQFSCARVSDLTNIDASIRNVGWEWGTIMHFSDYQNVTWETVGFNSTLSFHFNAIFKNSRDKPLNITAGIFWELPNELAPHKVYGGFVLDYIHSCCDIPSTRQNMNLTLETGRNLYQCYVRIIFFDFELGNRTVQQTYPQGNHTFWIEDINSSLEYARKSVIFYSSSVVNFFLHDYELILIGVAVCGLLILGSWITAKKIHRKRLHPNLLKILEELKILLYEAHYQEVSIRLDAILPDIELVNDLDLNQQWHDMKIRCLINLNMKKRLNELRDYVTRDELLKLLKEIHSTLTIDPLFESEIVERLKMID